MGEARKVPMFVSARRKRARRQRLIALAAVFFAVLSFGALYYWYQSQRALNDATAAISALVEATAESARANPHAENVEALFDMARKAINNFASSSNDPRMVEQRARSYLIFAEIDFEHGWIDRTREDAQLALANLDRLANNGSLEARHLRAQAERLIGTTHWERGNYEEAKLHFERGIADIDELLKRNVDVNVAWRWMRSLADLYQALGDVFLFRLGQRDDALAAFNKSLELRERLFALGHQGPALDFDLALIINKRAEVFERQGNSDEAFKLSTAALERMESLKDRIWDNLRWAADYGAVNVNIARLKRKQKRYAEAAPVFARAEEILIAVNKRDPKNATRTASLNWIRFLRAENLFRLGVQNNDRIRLLSAREQAQSIIATTTALSGNSSPRSPMRLDKVRQEAFLAAIDATLRQLNGNFESAAAGFLEASDIIANGYPSGTKSAPSGDLMAENVEYLEWAGMAYIKAQKPADAQTQFKRALDMLDKYRTALGEKVFEDFQQRIEARYDRNPPTASRTPPATVRAPASASRIPPGAERAPIDGDHGPTTTESVPPPLERAVPAPDVPPATAERAPSASDAAPPAAQTPAGEGSPPVVQSPPGETAVAIPDTTPPAADPAAGDPVNPPPR